GSAAHHRPFPSDGQARGPFAGRCARRGDASGGAVRSGAEPHQRARWPDHADQQRSHDPRPARAALSLTPFLPDSHRLLPLLQGVWYIPAGLDIWNQLLGKYPGRYATMKGMNVPPPSYGPVVWQQDQAPIVEDGTVEERLHAHMIATMSGDVRRAYGLFLGLAADPQLRSQLRDHLLFLGLIDVQDTIAGRKARNTGHKALRARAVTDLADSIGWDRAR